jgi:LytS/YehU family sensor histidine kinase
MLQTHPNVVLFLLLAFILFCSMWSGTIITKRHWLRPASAGIIAGLCAGLLAGIVPGLIVGMVFGIFAGLFDDGEAGVAVGTLAGIFSGVIAGTLTAFQTQPPVSHLLVVTLLVGCVVAECMVYLTYAGRRTAGIKKNDSRAEIPLGE